MIQNQNCPLGSLEILLVLAPQAPCVSWQILLCHHPNGEFFFALLKALPSCKFLKPNQMPPVTQIHLLSLAKCRTLYFLSLRKWSYIKLFLILKRDLPFNTSPKKSQQSSTSIPFYSKYVKTGKLGCAVTKLHEYLSNKELLQSSPFHFLHPPHILSVTPAEFGHLGGDGGERLSTYRAKDFAARDLKNLRAHTLSASY